MSRVTINGTTFEFEGNGSLNITSRDGTISVNGSTVIGIDNRLSGRVDLHVEGASIEKLEADGSVHCGEVTGNVNAGGSAHVGGNVGGSVSAGGSVKASGTIARSISAGGSVKIG